MANSWYNDRNTVLWYSRSGSVVVAEWIVSFIAQSCGWKESVRGRSVLEIGPGGGLVLAGWRRAGATAMGVDASAEMAEAASAASGCEVICGDGGKLPFRDGAYDLCMWWGVDFSMRGPAVRDELRQFLSEMERVVVRSGFVVISILNRRSAYCKVAGLLRQRYMNPHKSSLPYVPEDMNQVADKIGLRMVCKVVCTPPRFLFPALGHLPRGFQVALLNSVFRRVMFAGHQAWFFTVDK